MLERMGNPTHDACTPSARSTSARRRSPIAPTHLEARRAARPPWAAGAGTPHVAASGDGAHWAFLPPFAGFARSFRVSWRQKSTTVALAPIFVKTGGSLPGHVRE